MKVKIKYHEKTYGLNEIQRIKVGDWIDLQIPETVRLKAFESKLVPLGISMELPRRYEAIIAMRSSSYNKYGVILANGIGIIDNSYCGDNDEWKINLIALKDTEIQRGTRVCQFRIMRNQPMFTFEKVKTLSKKNRNGFGSTGD